MEAILLMSGSDGRWQPGIGDPTVVGWTTVVVYFVVAALSFRAWRRAAGQGDGTGSDPRSAGVWLVLVAVCTALGVNKQLDLQSLVTQIGEDLARAQGWYEHRRTVQAWFVLAVAIAGLGAAAFGFYLLRDRLARLWPALLGAGLLVTFVVIRAASFHHVDVLLFGPAGLNAIFELGSLCLIGWGALREAPLAYTGPRGRRGSGSGRRRKGPKIIPAGPNGELLPKRRRRSRRSGRPA